MSRRLRPLYIAAFLQGIPFWYAIEKLFMLEIGFNTASIGLMVAIMSTVMLAVETPSGVLADRWSRKGVMMLGVCALFVSGVLGVFSFNEPVYILSTVFWGIYAALYSGTYDAVIYDTTIEEYGDSKKFEQYLGRLKAVEGSAFVIGALLGGWIASTSQARHTYIYSLPIILLAAFFLWRFREPQIHKAEVSDPVYFHIRQTFAAVLKSPVLLPVVIATVGFAVLQDSVFELSQLWFIAVNAPVAQYGLFSAAVFSSWATGGLIAARIKSRSATILLMSSIVFCIYALIVTRDYRVVLGAQFILAAGLVALSVILSKKMHDELPSRLRAGSSSVVSTLARIVLIPGSLLFTAIAYKYTVFDATYLLLIIASIAILAYIFILPAKRLATRSSVDLR